MIDGGIFSLEAVQLLLKNGGNLHVRDYSGRTIILYTACCHGVRPDLPLLEALLERGDISREDKIDALEMAGAVLIGYEGKSEEDVALAFQYWRQALTLRLMNTEECPPIYKTPTRSMNGALNEWSTENDLLLLEQDPWQYVMQSILVQLRIFSSLGWRAVYKHMFHNMQIFLLDEMRKIFLLSELGQRAVSQALGIFWIVFDTVLRSDRPYEDDLCSALLGFVNALMLFLDRFPKDNPIFNSNNLQQIVEIVFMADALYFTDTNNPEAPVAEARRLNNLLAMVKILLSHPEKMTENVQLPLVQLLRRDNRDSSGRSLLQYICCQSFSNDTLPVVRFLVKYGADPNARDNEGRGVFHFLVDTTWNFSGRDASARLLLELGSHLDLADNQGRTAADLWLAKNNQQWQLLPDWLQKRAS